jgi:hypothetical protein
MRVMESEEGGSAEKWGELCYPRDKATYSITLGYSGITLIKFKYNVTWAFRV